MNIISLAVTIFEVLSGTVSNNNTLFNAVDSLVRFVSSIVGLIMIIIALYWFYRASANIRSFGATHTSSPAIAVICWFIPLYHLWKPYKIAQQIWKGSNPQINFINGDEWKKLPGSDRIKLWWILGISPFLILGIYIIVLILTFGGTGSRLQGDFKAEFYGNMISLLLIPMVIFSTIFFIRVIKEISRRQEIKSGRLMY
jgi:uncharacterized protein DUF4328